MKGRPHSSDTEAVCSPATRRKVKRVEQSKLLPVIAAFVTLEAINTFVNILPAIRQTSEQTKQKGLIRAGIVNVVIIAVCIAVFLRK